MRAICASHVPAARAAAAGAAEALSQTCDVHAVGDETLTTGMVVVAQVLPEAFESALLAPLEALFEHRYQVRMRRRE